jgi:ubiquitin-conjugating enzyme E2 Q
MESDPQTLGFSAEPDGNDIFNWRARVFGFEKDSPMSKDFVEMEVSFPLNYPDRQPFVRVIQPRFQFHTGRVTVGGSLCTDILTMESWKPIDAILGLMIAV